MQFLNFIFLCDRSMIYALPFRTSRKLGMEMAFIVKDGKGSQEKLLPPPPDIPQC